MVYYDTHAQEVVYIIDNQRLTIPDYMLISDIEYFITDRIYNSTLRQMQEVSIGTEQKSPLEKAKEHYKQLGWFRD